MINGGIGKSVDSGVDSPKSGLSLAKCRAKPPRIRAARGRNRAGGVSGTAATTPSLEREAPEAIGSGRSHLTVEPYV